MVCFTCYRSCCIGEVWDTTTLGVECSYDVAVRCRKGRQRCPNCAKKDKGVKRKKLHMEENSTVPDRSANLCIIIRVIATVWFIVNHFCRTQIYYFTVE